MRILYFTDGAGIDLLSIRTSLLRVPEVLIALRQTQNNVRYVDLMTVMGLEEEEFKKIPQALRTLLVNACQKGLHQRWVNRGMQSDMILRRINFRNFEDLKNEILKCLAIKLQTKTVDISKAQLIHFLNSVEITIIGPGYDEIEIWLRREVSSVAELKVLVKDVIDSDPALDWFWPQVRETVESQIFA